MDDLTVRPAATSDVADVRRVARESWHAAYDDVLGIETVESVSNDWYDLYDLRQSVEREDTAFLVAERPREGGDEGEGDRTSEDEPTDQRIVGFGEGVLGEEDAAAELSRLYVHPDHWGEGIGSALIDRIETWVAERGAERLRLIVLADNEIGNDFYESRGYRRVGTRESELEGETFAEYVREREV